MRHIIRPRQTDDVGLIMAVVRPTEERFSHPQTTDNQGGD